MERQTESRPVQAYEEVWRCPEGGCDGTMESVGGYVLTSSPPQYPHQCTDCGHKSHAPVRYPRIVHSSSIYPAEKPTDA